MANYKDKILLSIKNSYIDLNHPDYHFVMNRYSSIEYKRLMEILSKSFNIHDVTDLNYDVCIFLQLNFKNDILELYLSLVGKYCLLIYKDKIITCDNKPYTYFNALIELLLNHDFIFLNRETLLYEVDFDINASSFYTDDKKPTLLGLLFSFGLSI